MLVLSRRERESIIIGDDIVITVVEVRGNTVRLAFDAPRHVVIHREEIQQRIECELADDQSYGLRGANHRWDSDLDEATVAG